MGLRGIVPFTDALRYHAAVLAFWRSFPAPRSPAALASGHRSPRRKGNRMLIDYHLKQALNAPHGVYAEIIEVATNHLLHLTPLRPRERPALLAVLTRVQR